MGAEIHHADLLLTAAALSSLPATVDDVPSLEDVRVIAATLPGSEERATTGGAAWFVRNKVYAWQAHPWPSIPAEMRAIIAEESVVMVKVASEEDKLAYREGWPRSSSLKPPPGASRRSPSAST